VNVLINAAQSFAEDDVARNKVRIGASTGSGTVTITVQDNGRGIRPEHLPHVFDPFFTTKSAGEGTGLGLSIRHSIVSRDGGRIDVASTLGEGTTVTIVLTTAHDLPGREGMQANRPKSGTLPRLRILVVDDEPRIVCLLREILSSDHDVTATTSGSEAAALLFESESSFDVVLCDLAMPDISGLALYERSREPLRRRFVFMSGSLFNDELLARIGGPEAPRLEKPFSAVDVRDVLARVVLGQR
jgi:CheY-like chemotaxis protein